jgi:hypothetical protein
MDLDPGLRVMTPRGQRSRSEQVWFMHVDGAAARRFVAMADKGGARRS